MPTPTDTDHRMGRRSIFRGKLRTLRVQGIMSKDGMRAFERGRKTLAKLVACKPNQVSDADTIEYLARGDEETRKYLGK